MTLSLPRLWKKRKDFPLASFMCYTADATLSQFVKIVQKSKVFFYYFNKLAPEASPLHYLNMTRQEIGCKPSIRHASIDILSHFMIQTVLFCYLTTSVGRT